MEKHNDLKGLRQPITTAEKLRTVGHWMNRIQTLEAEGVQRPDEVAAKEMKICTAHLRSWTAECVALAFRHAKNLNR